MKLLAVLFPPLSILLKLSLLSLLFLVLGGPSIIDNTWAVGFTDTAAKRQFRSEGPTGPINQCKDSKTGKTQMVQCKNPPKQRMSSKVAMAELDKSCGPLDGLEDTDANR